MNADPASIAFLNDSYRPLSECLVPINLHALQYGTGCFEGIRGYYDEAAGTLNLLLLREHYDRLHRNARMLFMESPGVERMCEITVELIRRNGCASNTYIRPVVYKNCTDLGPKLCNLPDGFMCYVQKLNDYLDTAKGLDVCVSSWTRIGDNQIPTRAKACGGYINSALAKTEAVQNGYDEAVFLNRHGEVAEGSAENLFIVRDGVLATPTRAADILEGITRQVVIDLAADLGIRCEERPIARTELYRADECFLVGTGCQIAYVRTVDRRTVGDGVLGPVTAQIQNGYEAAVYGQDPKYRHWLTPVC